MGSKQMNCEAREIRRSVCSDCDDPPYQINFFDRSDFGRGGIYTAFMLTEIRRRASDRYRGAGISGKL